MPLSFFARRLQVVLLPLHNRSDRAMLLKTGKTDEALNTTENKTNSITNIFFLEYRLDLELLYLPSWNFFSEYF